MSISPLSFLCLSHSMVDRITHILLVPQMKNWTDPISSKVYVILQMVLDVYLMFELDETTRDLPLRTSRSFQKLMNPRKLVKTCN